MLSTKNKKQELTRGFTLIEILLVVAMIAILAGAILTSISGQREKAQSSKVLAEISSRLQPMMMCWSDGGNVDSVPGDGGASICSSSSAYGVWPTLPTGFSYGGSIPNSSSWSIIIDGGGARICCNSTTSQCGVIASGATCNASTPGSF